MKNNARALLLSALGLFAMACGSSVSMPGLDGGSIDTVLPETIIDIGDAITVDCVALDKDGDDISAYVQAVITAEPAEGVTIDGLQVTGVTMGKYSVTCASHDGVLVDDTPAVLHVVKDGIRGVDTILKETTVPAGTKINVSCTLTDENDAAVEGNTLVNVDPDEGVTIVDGTMNHHVTFTIVGSYDVACESEDTGLQDTTPVIVHVVPADPALITALPETDTAAAGDAVLVACRVEDAYGNLIDGLDTSVEDQEGLDVQGHTVIGEIAGEYEIFCLLDGSTEDAGLEYIGAPLFIEAGEPASVELKPTPKRDRYDLKATVVLNYVVLDEYGNEMEGVDATFGIPDGPGLSIIEDNKFAFLVEGLYEVSVTLVAPYDDITDSAVLVCDETGPDIIDLYPPRGETITGEAMMPVYGSLGDNVSDIVTLTINNDVVEVAPDGTFEYGVPCKHGANHFRLRAMDEFGNSTETTRGWYYSTGWQPSDLAMEEARITDGAMVFMGQSLLDDGDHDPAHLDDLATIIEVLLGSLDFEGLIGSFGDLGFDLPGVVDVSLPLQGFNADIGIKGDLYVGVEILEVTIGTPSISIESRDGGIAMSGAFAPVEFGIGLVFEIDIYAQAVLPALGIDFQSLPWTVGTYTASSLGAAKIALLTDYDVEKLPDQLISVQAKNFHLELQNVDIDPLESLVFDFGELNIPIIGAIDLGEWDLSQFVGNINDFLSTTVLNPLVNLITQPLIDLVEPLVEGLLGTVIEQFVALVVIDMPIDIPPLMDGMDPLSLDFHTSLSTVLFSDEGGQLGLNIGLQSDKGVDRDPLGSILRDGCSGADPEPIVFSFDPEPEMQIGAKYDFVNQALFAVWWSGFLNMDVPLGSLLGEGGAGGLPIDLSNMDLATAFYLPPMLNDCGNKGQQELHVADLLLDAHIPLAAKNHHVQIWLQVRAAANIEANDNEIGISIGAIQTFEYEIDDITGELGPLLGLVTSFIPQLLDMVEGQSFSFPIPPIGLDIIPGVPAGAELQLGNMSAYNKKGATVVGGDLL